MWLKILTTQMTCIQLESKFQVYLYLMMLEKPNPNQFFILHFQCDGHTLSIYFGGIKISFYQDDRVVAGIKGDTNRYIRQHFHISLNTITYFKTLIIVFQGKFKMLTS